jgi:UDP-N-acetylglucosamine 2-epimerase (non-hydrolysing)
LKKILFIFGTRPEAIKMAPVINVFKKDSKNYKTLVSVTAQHREMLDQVLKVFKIVPDYDLNLMSNNQTLENLTGKILNGISRLLKKIKPDLIFVQGDTTTTFAASLAAFYQKIPVAHIEAGLRTKNKYSPFPEEINRCMTSAIATYHFPPTEQAGQNLQNEGVEKGKIEVTGNTVIDALLSVSAKIDSDIISYEKYFLSEFGINFKNQETILATVHRRESFGKSFENICKAFKQIAENKNLQIIYPVHLNPNVQQPVKRILGGLGNVHLIPPQDYVPFVFLMKKSYIILTDSGGVQEEAPSLGKPVLVMRDATERLEGVEAGTARLVGTNPKIIIHNTELLLNDKMEYENMAKANNPYGIGKASKKIYHHLLNS